MTDFSHADRSPPQRLHRFMVRGLRSLVLGAVISLVFVLLFAQHFWSALIYSTSIAFCCWFFIDGGRIVVASWVNPPQEIERRGQWPGWAWMVAILLIGTVLGYSVGNAFSNWVTGNNAPGIIASHPRQALGLLVFSLLPGIAATYFFFSRERIAASEARAQTAQREAAENQLRLLESQLEPHMLFNTLANLRVLIGTDPARAQAMLDQLIGFLRATLNASRAGAHPLQAEFARLSDYLSLMKVRMGERLQSRFDLPELLADAPVPPLILQPLVENCIKHGVEPVVDGGRIEVAATSDAGQLVLTVRDTGAGLGAAGDASGASFGLAQVRQRLATLYGDRASLTLAAAGDAEGGTLATVRLPLAAP